MATSTSAPTALGRSSRCHRRCVHAYVPCLPLRRSPGIGLCPHCGACIDKPSADLDQQVRALLDHGQKIAAVKLYKDQAGVSLAEAKAAVEAMQADAGPTSRPGIRDDLEAELLRLLGGGNKLEAIKLYKDRTGVALLEAKQAVESLAANHGLVTTRAGCLGLVMAVVAAISLAAAFC